MPMSNVIVTTGEFVADLEGEVSLCPFLFQGAPGTVDVLWSYHEEPEPSCIRIGDEISVELVFEDGSGSLLIEAVLVSSGFYWAFTF